VVSNARKGRTGSSLHPVVIKDGIFQDNRVRLTGAAIDLLPASRAELASFRDTAK